MFSLVLEISSVSTEAALNALKKRKIKLARLVGADASAT